MRRGLREKVKRDIEKMGGKGRRNVIVKDE